MALAKASNDAIPICYVGEMRPVYSQGPDGMVYSCAMSSVDRQQGFINGIPYCSASFIPVCNGVTGKTFIEGCCVKIYPTANQIIEVQPRLIKGLINCYDNISQNYTTFNNN